MTNKKYNVLDLFAGCGGLSKGFEQAGFNIAGANEFWAPAGETYVQNHKETIFVPGDVTLDETKIQIYNIFKNQQCDVLTGGPPCQAYSTAGLRDPDDPRGRLFEDYVEIVDKLQPKIFVMENVKGILTMEHDREDLSEEETKDFEAYKLLEKERAELVLLRKKSKNNPEKFKWGNSEIIRLDQVRKDLRVQMKDTMQFREKITDQIVRRFKKIGYNVKFKLLTASDFGVPQKRQRVIFIGTKFPIEIKHPEPTHSKDGVNLPKWNTVRNAIDNLSDKPEDIAFNHIITTHSPEFLEKIKNTKIGSSVFGGYADAFFRNQPDEPSRTVKENHGGVLVHYKNNRVMTPRELARLQSFPDDFIFASSKSNILKQIGNAVPVGLGAAIGRTVRDMLSKIEELDKEKIGTNEKINNTLNRFIK